MKSCIYLAVLSILTLGGLPGLPVVMATGGWLTLAPLPEPRQEVAVVALAGKVYVIGGIREDRTTADTVEVYDPATNRWQRVSPLPLPLHHTAAAVVQGRLYVIGGLTGMRFAPVNTVFVYDPQTDHWSSRAAMPAARGALAVAVIDGKIYAAGGSPAARERDFAVYDPESDTWTPLPPMPTPRNHLAAGTIGGKFYAVGGRSGGIGGITDALEVYDPGSRTWARKTSMPTARGGIAGAVVKDCLYVFGGEGNPNHPAGIFAQSEVYNPQIDTWQGLPPMPTPRHGIGAAAVGDRIYIPGGAEVQGFGVSAVHEAFQVEKALNCTVQMSQTDYAPGETVVVSTFRLANEGTIPVPVELKVWLESPDSPPIALVNRGAGGTVSLPPGFDRDFGPIPLFQVTGETAPGTYKLGCRLLHPVTGSLLVDDLTLFLIP